LSCPSEGLANHGYGGWVAVRVDGSAARLVATVGAYDSRCQEHPPAAELAIARAETSGVATLSSTTDVACLHVRPPCTIPQQRWDAHRYRYRRLIPLSRTAPRAVREQSYAFQPGS
jgi:hypothetical protein